MRRFEAYPSKSKLLGLFLLGCTMVGISAFCVTRFEIKAIIAGVAGLVFFGFCTVVTVYRFFQSNTPQIVMDDTGIQTGNALGNIEWGDIVGFRVDEKNGNRFLSVFVFDKQKYLQRMSIMARKSAELNPLLGHSEIVIGFSGLSPGIEQACHYLQEKGFEVSDS